MSIDLVSRNNRINSDWQFRCAPLPAGYAGVLHDKVVKPTLMFNVKKMKNKYIIILFLSFLIIAITLITLPTRGQENDFTKKNLTRMNIPTTEKKRIIIGADVNYPPYSFMDKQGRPQGHDIEIMNKLAAMLKIQVEYKLRP
ncbi:MAG: transporter substrate-binding domain-containing protein, partial [Proteobacteria bacterium]|nr:transporter substrate-binding domain-containing protein [Pseudomonadota bacterium]